MGLSPRAIVLYETRFFLTIYCSEGKVSESGGGQLTFGFSFPCMIFTVYWLTACIAVLFELVISRPNSRVSFAMNLGIDPARVVKAMSVFDF